MTTVDIPTEQPGSPARPGARRGKPAAIANKLKEWIAEHGLQPGDRMPGEKELIDDFQASKGTIREALKVLETQGLIESRTGPGGGTFVTATSEQHAMMLLGSYFFFNGPSIGDIYAMRKILEPELAASVVGRLNEADLTRLEQTMLAYAEPPVDLDEERQQRHAELDFHGILSEFCPNPVLAFQCRFLHRLLRDLTICRKIYRTPNPDLRESGFSYQRRLLKALQRSDSEEVRAIMYDHMCTAQRHMERAEAFVQNRFLGI